jgi:hypothetical protein
MEGTARWFVGGLVVIVGIIGLFLAAHAHDRGIYGFGLALFTFAVLFVFGQIKQSFDARDRSHRESLGRSAG